MEPTEPRKRGAQLGNTNALKHGYYSRSLDRLGQQQLAEARALDATDLSEEIALQRARLFRLNEAHPEHFDLLVKVVGQLTRTVIAHFAMRGGAADRLVDATNNVLDEMRQLLQVDELVGAVGAEDGPI